VTRNRLALGTGEIIVGDCRIRAGGNEKLRQEFEGAERVGQGALAL
jgi:hypothetical protein